MANEAYFTVTGSTSRIYEGGHQGSCLQRRGTTINQ